MKRITTLAVAGLLSLAVASTASAQVNLSFGGLNGRGTTLSFGQPSYGGYGYAQQGVYGSTYGNYASPYTAYNGLGNTAYSPYTSGTTYYSSGYRGYAAPSTTVYQQGYTGSPYGYNTGYGVASPYSGYASPYNNAYRGYNAYQGVPLIRGNGFSVNLMPR